MLVLSRKEREEIVIGHDITVRVVGIEGGRVQIGVVAPKDTPVNRREVYTQLSQEGREFTEPGRGRRIFRR